MGKVASSRGIVAGIALVLTLAILLTGTFAWQSISQQALNPATGGPRAPLPDGATGGRLHDDYEVVDEWTSGRRANKDVYIENFGVAGYDEAIFVRIRLYEFMGFSETPWPSVGSAGFTDHAHTPIRPGMHLDDPFSWIPRQNWVPCLVSGDANTTDASAATYDPFRRYWHWDLGGYKYYIPTFNRDPNSTASDVKGDAIDPQAAGVTQNPTRRGHNPLGPDQDGFPASAGNANFWDNDSYWYAFERQPDGTLTSERVRHDARRTLSAEVVTMAAWQAAGSPSGNFWVIDTDGWAYWAAPLAPETATGLLLSAITLHTVPADYYWYYAIFIDAQMATADYWDADDAGFFSDARVPSAAAIALLEQITAGHRTQD